MTKKLLFFSALLFGAVVSAASGSSAGELAVARRDGKIYLRNRFSSTHDLVTEILAGRNGQLEIGSSRKIPAGIGVTSDAMTRGVTVYYAADEGAPLLTNYGNVGANHRALTALTLTVPRHGFTESDIGSTPLKAGNRTYYIVQIPDSDTLLVMSENIGRNGIGFFDRSSLKKDFSARGKLFNVQKLKHSELVPNVRLRQQHFLLDGVPLPAGEFIRRGSTFVCHEKYEIVSPASFMDFLRKHPGGRLNAAAPAIAAALEITNCYTFTPDGTMHLKQKIRFLEKNSLRQWGLLQIQGLYTPGRNPFREYFIPKTQPFSQDGIRYDFAKGFIVTKPLPVLRFIPDRIADPAALPERFIQIAGRVDSKAGRLRETGLVIGFSLFDGESRPRLRQKSAALLPVWINRTQKTYPYVISSPGGLIMEPGKELEASGYRKLFDPGKFGKAAQASYIVQDGQRKLLYLHFTEAGETVIPSVFRKIVEKSSGVTISGSKAVAKAAGDYAVME